MRVDSNYSMGPCDSCGTESRLPMLVPLIWMLVAPGIVHTQELHEMSCDSRCDCGVLCQDCVEAKLGRSLTRDDFERPPLTLADVRDALAKAKPCDPSAERDDKIAECLVRIFFLYNGYKIGSRGPDGCIMDALDLVAPAIAQEIRDGGDVHMIFMQRWGEE